MDQMNKALKDSEFKASVRRRLEKLAEKYPGTVTGSLLELLIQSYLEGGCANFEKEFTRLNWSYASEPEKLDFCLFSSDVRKFTDFFNKTWNEKDQEISHYGVGYHIYSTLDKNDENAFYRVMHQMYFNEEFITTPIISNLKLQNAINYAEHYNRISKPHNKKEIAVYYIEKQQEKLQLLETEEQ